MSDEFEYDDFLSYCGKEKQALRPLGERLLPERLKVRIGDGEHGTPVLLRHLPARIGNCRGLNL